jgi:hypothetical protein
MTILTIFSTPKPFTDPHIATIQRNAIQSWLNLGADVDVLLVGEEAGLDEVASEYDLQVIKNVERNTSGTPLVSSIFSTARDASSSPFLVYVNADIILMRDLAQSIEKITSSLRGNREEPRKSNADSPFLLIGQRWDLDVRELLDFSNGWEERIREDVKRRGNLHRPAGSDYFLFPRPAFQEMPDFAIGRAGWDNWMIYHARQQGWPVIDGTADVMIVHQNHDYSHLPGGKPHYDLEESQQNKDMAGGKKHMYMVLDANYQLVDGKLRKPPLSKIRIIRQLERWMMPKSGSLSGFRGKITRRLRRMRRKIA